MHFFKIPQGILLYENKDKHQLKGFEASCDEDMAESLFERLQRIADDIGEDKLPARPKRAKIKERRCEYCGYRECCRGETWIQ